MFWRKEKKEKDEQDGVPRLREDSRPESLKEDIPRHKLSRNLQKLVDREDDYYDELYTPYSVDTTETPYRYAAYANRVRTILLSAHRYIAYTSDVGESFRPVAHPYLVRSAYAISWSYILGDVAHEGYKAYLRNRRVLIPPGEAYKDATDLKTNQVVRGMTTGNIAGPLTSESPKSDVDSNSDPLIPWASSQIPLIDDYRMVMVKRAVFQSIASMGLPAFTIHSVVRYSGRALKNSKNVFLRTWAPIGLGLSVVPLLPYLFDQPVEHAVEWSFQTLCRAVGGPEAVQPPPPSSELPAKKTMPLSSLLKLQDEKNRHKADIDRGNDKAPSWEEYKEDKQRQREQRKTGTGGWFGFGSKKKEE
ncbi:mitochondrial 18 KDa protein-domain-containing protein [Talaromyces proteolyticus]|uniref:Mitochondrial fission process protein 1 n=1 Tax=Talaromyces proteolyticus TaxID=1131652 RepID=A0AAD4KGX3_9EURO|nr:mitochondrial 18 KDa protein-domain-containing protein [Talaromyces proteolyticus]KAH8690860.1 mitochondrial 18 KDa protein-domain-containing protein [Talaromyces proteolyticus]